MSAPAASRLEPGQQRLQIADVERWAGVERSTINRWCRAGKFPQPERFGQRRLWQLSVLEAWAAERAAKAE